MELVQLRDSIEKMTKFNQIAILRILHGNDDITLNENRNGIHVNLTDLDGDIVQKISDYVTYVHTQEATLKQDEQQKENIKNIYFS
jgi:hypothetical protein